LREGLDPVEGGDQRDGDATLGIHLAAKEDVLGKVLGAEVVLAANGNGNIFKLLQSQPTVTETFRFCLIVYLKLRTLQGRYYR
jgi:hypothetical protein